MAPEIILRKKYCGKKADVWAMGIILFVLLTGYFPFRGLNEKDTFNKICRGFYEMPKNVSVEAKQVIGKCLNIDPSKRLTCTQVSPIPNPLLPSY